jgi:5'-nucleotidase
MLIALPWAAAQEEEEPFTLTLLHTNDTHAAHAPNRDGDGGVARQLAVQRQIEAEGGNVLVLDAGDRFMGTLFHTTYLGQDQVQVMNLLGYDAMALGNHEFDNGDGVLAAFVSGVNFPVLAANIGFDESPDLAGLVLPYTILEVDGEQIGVIGITTADTLFESSPGAELVWNDDYIAVANAAAEELTAQGVNKIVLLTHTGIGVDVAIIEGLVGVDVVLGGHTHTLMGNQAAAATEDYPLVFESAAGEPVVYAQAGANNQYLGRLDLEFDAAGLVVAQGGDTIFLSRYISPDPEGQALVDELSVQLEQIISVPVGASTTLELIGDRTVCRIEECPLGIIIADAMRFDSGAQIALMNGGGIRANIDEGEITLGDALTVQPFGNQIATFSIDGANILLALEQGVSRLTIDENGNVSRESLAGAFLQVSGLRYTIDATQEPGSRIVAVEVEQADGSFAPIDPTATYTVVTNNFMRQGGDGYSMLAENAIDPYDFGRIDYEVTIDYLISLGEITEETVAPQGRISYENAQPAPLE